MSIEAMAHVLGEQVGDPTRKLILLAYANHSHRDGTGAWCSVTTVSEYAETSTRTVRRHLPVLLDEGRLREGDQHAVQHMPAAVRPIVYDVAMSEQARQQWAADRQPGRRDAAAALGRDGGIKGSATRHPLTICQGVEPSTPPDTGVSTPLTPEVRPPDTGVSQTVLEPSDEPSEELLLIVTDERPSAGAVGDCDLDFAAFYGAYPRKVGKDAARRAFVKARARVGGQVIIDGAQRFAADSNLPGKDERHFIPHPASWLNAGRWDDEPLPPRRRGTTLHVDERQGPDTEAINGFNP